MFDAVAAALACSGAARSAAPRPATREELARVHDAGYLDGIAATAGRAVMLDADTFTSPESLEIARPGGRRRRAGRRARARSPRAGVRARPSAGPPRRARPRDGLLPLQQRRRRRGGRASRAASTASRSSTSTCITATARSGCSTTIRRCSTSRPTSSRSIREPARPTRSARATGRGFTVNVPLEAGATDADYYLAYSRARRAGARPVRAGADARLRRLRRARTRSAGLDADDRRTGIGAIVAAVASVAAPHGALALVTEGGYDLDALTRVPRGVVRGDPGKAAASDPRPGDAGAARRARHRRRPRGAQARFWRL